MNVPISEANDQLTDLVRRAEAGEDVVLTRDGRPAVRLVAVTPAPAVDRAAKLALFEAISKSAVAKMTPGPCAARSQDFLYDDDGLPG